VPLAIEGFGFMYSVDSRRLRELIRYRGADQAMECTMVTEDFQNERLEPV